MYWPLFLASTFLAVIIPWFWYVVVPIDLVQKGELNIGGVIDLIFAFMILGIWVTVWGTIMAVLTIAWAFFWEGAGLTA